MKRFFILSAFTFFVAFSNAQSVAINTTGATAAGSAILDVNSTSKGFLMPRMTASQRLAIVSPALGLQVFQTDNVANNPSGFYFFNGSTWVNMTAIANAGTAWTLSGNSGTNASANFLGTTDAIDFKVATNSVPRMTFKSTGEVGIGTNSPNGILGLTRGNITSNQPLLRLDDNTTTATSASIILFNVGNNSLLDGSTLGTATMMRLSRQGSQSAAGDGLRIENQGTGVSVRGEATNGIAIVGHSVNNGGGSFTSDKRTAITAFGDGAAEFHSNGISDGMTLVMNGVKDGVQPIHGFDMTMKSTGTAPVIGLDVLAESNTAGVQVVGILSKPLGGANASITCFLGEGNMAITGQYLISSDRKLKKDITPMSSVMDKIMKLSPANYLYRSDEYKINLPATKQHGLIAQELQSVFPELVTQQIIPARYDKDKKLIADKVDFLSVNYIGLVPVLIKGMQEQQAQIDALQKENAQLQKDIAAIKAKLGL